MKARLIMALLLVALGLLAPPVSVAEEPFVPMANPPTPLRPPTLAELTTAADAVVEGVLSLPAPLATDGGDGERIIDQGVVDMKVRRWFKGEGPARIRVNFGRWDPERDNPLAGDAVILFLQAPRPAGAIRLVADDAYRHIDWVIPRPDRVEAIIATVGREPTAPPLRDVVTDALDNPAAYRSTLLWLGAGLAGVAVAVIGIALWRRRRRTPTG